MTESVSSVQEGAKPELDGPASGCVRVGLYGLAGFLLVGLFLGIYWRTAAGGGSLESEDRSWFYFFFFGFLILSCFTSLSFMAWTSRMRKNLDMLRVRGLHYEPFWAVWGYFVPFLNLIRPYMVMQEIVQASQPQENPEDPTAWQKAPGSLTVFIWWIVHLSSGIAITVWPTLGESVADREMTEIWLVYSGPGLVAALLMTQIVWQVERWQKARWEVVQALPPLQDVQTHSPAPREESAGEEAEILRERSPAPHEKRQEEQEEQEEQRGTLQERSAAPEDKILPPLPPAPAPALSVAPSSPFWEGVAALFPSALILIVLVVCIPPAFYLACSAGALILVGVIKARSRPASGPLSHGLVLKPVPRAVWGAAVLLGFGGFLLWEGAFVGFVNNAYWPPRLLRLSFADLFLGPVYWFGSGGMLLIFGLAFSFGEELLFRGFVLPSFLSKWSPLKAILMTALFSAVLHVHPTAMLAAALLGIACGFARVLTGSLWPAVAIHAVHNTALVFLGIDRQGLVFMHPDVAFLGLLFWSLGLWLLLHATDGLRLPALDRWVEWLKPSRELRADRRFLKARLLTGATLVAALVMATHCLQALLKDQTDPFFGSFEIGLQLTLAWAALRGSRAAALAPIGLLLARLGINWGAVGPLVGILFFFYTLGAVGAFIQHRVAASGPLSSTA